MAFKKEIKDFDLGQIANSGQCFRMNVISDNLYRVIAKGQYLEVEQKEDTITFSCSEEEFVNLWSHYFDLETDYKGFKESIDPQDAFLQSAIKSGGGIRILHQDLWEMIITFIISQQNNIPRIKKCVETLCTNYGDQKLNHTGQVYYSFPTANALSKLTEEELRACNLGYRSKYILKTAKDVNDQIFVLDQLWSLDYEDAKKELLKLFGVGIKVAECICLFALHHIEAFPIDTHIKAVLDTYYPNGFPFERYEGYAGVLQQYAFYYKLSL